MIDKKEMGRRIRVLRQEEGIYIKDLAVKIGITRSALGNIERGSIGASLDVAAAIADYYNVSLDYLVGRSDDPVRR